MRALPCAPSVRMGICHPSHERDCDTEILQRQRHQARIGLLAGGRHDVVLAGVEHGGYVGRHLDHPVGHAGHGGYDHGDLAAVVDLLLDPPSRILDAFDIGDGCPAEFLNDTRHIG